MHTCAPLKKSPNWCNIFSQIMTAAMAHKDTCLRFPDRKDIRTLPADPIFELKGRQSNNQKHYQGMLRTPRTAISLKEPGQIYQGFLGIYHT